MFTLTKLTYRIKDKTQIILNKYFRILKTKAVTNSGDIARILNDHKTVGRLYDAFGGGKQDETTETSILLQCDRVCVFVCPLT